MAYTGATGPKVKWGTQEIPSLRVYPEMGDEDSLPVYQGPSSRSARDKVRTLTLDNFSGGMGLLRGAEARDSNRFTRSDLYSIAFEQLTLPYPLEGTEILSSVDFTGYAALNKRIHTIISTLGQSRPRFYAAVGNYLLRSTSDSDETLVDSGIVRTNTIDGGFEGVVNSTRALIFPTRGDTDDIWVTTDPTASPPVASSLFAYTAGDGGCGGHYFPTLGQGYNIFYGKFGGTSGLWGLPNNAALLTSFRPVAEASSRNVEASLTGVTVTRSPDSAWWYESTTMTGGLVWSNVSNIASSNNTYAVVNNIGAVDGELPPIVAGFTFGAQTPPGANIPPAAIIKGITVTVEAKNTDTLDNATFKSVKLLFDGAAVSPNRAADVTAELDTSDTVYTFGGSADPWGLNLTGADVQNIGVEVIIEFLNAGGTSSDDISVDHITMAVTYKLPGQIAYIPLGGYVLGPDPQSPHTLYIVAPEFNDEFTSVEAPRILWKCEFAFDATRDGPVVTVTKVYTALTHIESACFAMGGLIAAGGTPGSTAKACRFVDLQSGAVRDLGAFGPIAAQVGTYTWGIVNLFGSETGFLAEVAVSDTAGTIPQQWWAYFDESWHPMSALTAVGASGSRLPLRYAEHVISRRNNVAANTAATRVHYTLFPATTGGVERLGVRWQQTPFNINEANNVSFSDGRIKADGPLSLETVEMDVGGPEEGNKALLVAWCFSRNVSATNTCALSYSTDGGSTYTSWGTFTSFGSRLTLSTAVNFRTMKFKITLDHTASSDDTPQPLPIVIESDFGWRKNRRWHVLVDTGRPDFKTAFSPDAGTTPGTMYDVWNALNTLAKSNPVQTLRIGTESVLTRWVGFSGAEEPNATLGTRTKATRRGVGAESAFLDTRQRLIFEEVGA